MTDTPGRRRWRPRTRKIPEPARHLEPVGNDGPTAASAVQLAIALLTASLDSPELEERAAWALVPEDPEALAGVIAGLHLVNLLLLHQLYEATGEPPATTLQKLAVATGSECGPRERGGRPGPARPDDGPLSITKTYSRLGTFTVGATQLKITMPA